MTPVSAESIISLQNLIKQDAHTLNRTSTQRLERHVQKPTNAAQMSFAESAFFYDQKQMSISLNNEAKVRLSTRSIVLGKAKVMSFEDIEVARAARCLFSCLLARQQAAIIFKYFKFLDRRRRCEYSLATS